LAPVADAETKEEVGTNQEKYVSGGPDGLIPASHGLDFNILRLDLKPGGHGSSNSPASLVSQLEKASIANLLDERIGPSVHHIGKLRLHLGNLKLVRFGRFGIV